MNQTQTNCLNSLENAHTSIHQAIELLKKESIERKTNPLVSQLFNRGFIFLN